MYSDDELLNKLKELSAKIKRIPKKEDINNSDCTPDASTYLDRFGGIGNALEIIQLPRNRHDGLTINDFILIAKAYYEKNGVPPLTSDFDSNEFYPHSSFVQDLGYTWIQFLKMSGLPTYSRGSNWIKNRKAELKIKDIFIKQSIPFIDNKESRADNGSFIVNGKSIRVRVSQIYIQKLKTKQIYTWKFKIHRYEGIKVDYYICIGEDNDENIGGLYLFPTNEISAKKCISINIDRPERSKYYKYLIDEKDIKNILAEH